MKTELILPGGDLERVKIAFKYGADAVYVGLNKHSLRKAEVRFDIPEIGEAIEYAHSIGKRLFVTFNIFAHNKHLSEIEKDMAEIAKFGPDAFIMADLGVINIAKKVAPHVPIHVSTQANTVNIEDVKFWRDFGAKRVVLARELTLEEIKEIHSAIPDIELEAFVHGSMCISYSGRCLLSNYMTNRHSNLGECAQPCRWNYNVYLEEKTRPGEYYPAEESSEGTYIMSSKDLALVTELDRVLDSGVLGLKVEGRNKSDYYLASVGYTYRKALNLIEDGKFDENAKNELYSELTKINSRDYTKGFIYGDAISGETYEGRAPIRDWEYVGKITKQDGDYCQIIVKNKILKNDTLEILSPEAINKTKVLEILNEEKTSINEINPGKLNQIAYLKLSTKNATNTFLRKVSK
jgi:putative protease